MSEIDHRINQRIFETSLDLILVVDKRGTFIRVSPSSKTILGYEPAELAGRSAREILYPEDLESTRQEMRQARHSAMMRNFECRYVHKDGHVVTLWWVGIWSKTEYQYFFIGRDVTEQRRSEEQIRQAQKWRRSATSRAAWRMISIMCSGSSSAISTLPRRSSAARPAN
jgi:PAS domain S-box-containing protein